MKWLKYSTTKNTIVTDREWDYRDNDRPYWKLKKTSSHDGKYRNRCDAVIARCISERTGRMIRVKPRKF